MRLPTIAISTLLLLTTTTQPTVIATENKSMQLPHQSTTDLLNQLTYGIDVSFPLQSGSVSTNYAWLPHNVDPARHPTPEEFVGMPVQPLGDRQSFFNKFMEGCVEYNEGEEECIHDQKERISRNIRQPQSMLNYTDVGFKKIKTPDEVFSLLKKFWDDNQDKHEEEDGYRHTNYWESPTYLLDVEEPDLTGGGEELIVKIIDATKSALQEWTGQTLAKGVVNGIRKFTSGAVHATHLDRIPMIFSVVINVDEDLDEPWVMEFYDHEGKAHNVTMEPGDMVMYESHSVMHGRPFPLKGRHNAILNIHFEMEGDMINGLPPYIIEGSPEAELYRYHHSWQSHEFEAEEEEGTGANGAHYAANIGDLDTLIHIMKNERAEMLYEHDNNGWLPIHEAARGGHVEIIQALVDHGVDINERTNFGKGESVLHLAYGFHDEDHPIIEFLLSLGAEDIGHDEEL